MLIVFIVFNRGGTYLSDYKMKKLDESGLDKVSGGAADHPGQQKIGYTVKRGDTLIKIANQFGVSVLDLVTWNDIRNPDLIYPGQLLVIYKSA